MRNRPEAVWLVIGAVLGGMIVGPFRLQPPWLWGMFGGLFGGALGAAAGYLSRRAWPVPMRALAVLLLLGAGFFALWMISSGQFLLEWVRQTNPGG
jgi:hypothetical protein